jgi:hypothetical protein
VSFAAYVCLSGPSLLFPVYVRSRGGTTATVSYMWMVMLTMETILMFASSTLHRQLGLPVAVALGIAGCGLRWIGCALSHDVNWVYPLQALHGIYVVSLQVSAAVLVDTLVPARLRATSQAGLSLWGTGVGGIAASVLSGELLDIWGVDAVMWFSGVTGVALGVTAPWLLRARPAATDDTSTSPTLQAPADA